MNSSLSGALICMEEVLQRIDTVTVADVRRVAQASLAASCNRRRGRPQGWTCRRRGVCLRRPDSRGVETMAVSPISADTAVTAARAALWTWSAGDGASPSAPRPAARCQRSTAAGHSSPFSPRSMGLHASSIASRLREGRPGDPVDVRVTLIDGRPAHFVGTFHDLGVARGLIVSADASTRFVYGESNVEPVFQAIRRLDDLSVAGFEALARFRAPDGTACRPRDACRHWAAIPTGPPSRRLCCSSPPACSPICAPRGATCSCR